LPSLIARLFWFVLFVVVGIIRTVWLLVIPFFIVGTILAVLGISWQWMLPILVVFGVAIFVVLWNRHPYRNRPYRNP
jgi:hypothetical protein